MFPQNMKIRCSSNNLVGFERGGGGGFYDMHRAIKNRMPLF